MTFRIVSPIAAGDDDHATALSDDLLALVHSYMEPRRAAAGTVLFTEGDAAAGAYVIRRGEVRLGASPADGTVEVGRRGPGEFIGETALSDAVPYAATAVCHTDCELLGLSLHSLQEIAAAYETIGQEILQALIVSARRTDLARQRILESRMRELASARPRLAETPGRLDPALTVG